MVRVFQLQPARWALENIQRRRVKVSTFGDLNDPFELLSARLPARSLRQAFYSFKADTHASMGILCFSRNWASPLMWSHYANKHRGIALGFDIPDQYAEPVKYIKERAAVKFQDDLPTKGIRPVDAHAFKRGAFRGFRRPRPRAASTACKRNRSRT